MFIDDLDKRKTTAKRKKDDPDNYSEDEKETEEVAKKGAEVVKRNPIPTAIITVLLSVSVYLLVKTLRNK